MNTYLFYGQIVVSIILVVLVALQQRGTALGSAFGGGGEFYSSRRGMQKNLFYATVVVAGIFIVLSILNVLL
ncbi:MAG: preprotein translocase subunit SecG [Candidatus Staskawiczbacteria bacterium RIFCSPHIGHO2_02_FULL_33_16]|uniref:Protein-export membrane protein SecG n=1 Tax=Candidatus Staskawiczbacteria bacterium RIFCSPHIGHO2_02_FULL_33_16 TaxID=1802204 RepID=A0A1G2HYC3_9BACT|nr:MAG: preprotein translocase subunit SecG [Candidatus Staskawiczbacteria bacterium RIFCSPHIGHO2_02_FULL_33_16]OGZ70997.1 MAG: preprotein translocase subunit SecG [Candidatus Staskawiczbacteria bacterium RIFCSPLOWO2_01_FULL_33_13]